MSDLSDERVREWAEPYQHIGHPAFVSVLSDRSALAREVLALRERVAELTAALAGDGRVITGNEAGRHVGRLMREMAERHPEFRDGLLEIADDVERASAHGDEELAYQRGRAEVKREAASKLLALQEQITREQDTADALRARLAAITGEGA